MQQQAILEIAKSQHSEYPIKAEWRRQNKQEKTLWSKDVVAQTF